MSKEVVAKPTIVMITRQFCDISYGGVEAHILNLSRKYCELGLKVKVIRIGETASNNIMDESFDFIHLSFGGSRGQIKGSVGSLGTKKEFLDRLRMNMFSPKQYENLLMEIGDANVIHFHDLSAITRLARKLSKNKSIIWTNHLGEFLRISRIPFGPFLLRQFSKVFVITFAPSIELGNPKCIASPVYEIPNGFDAEKFTFETDKLRFKEKLGLPTDKRVILVPRRWAPNKGVANLTHAMKQIERRDCIFVFLGSETQGYADYHESILNNLRQWHIEYRLVKSVSVDEMADWFHASEFTFIPSLEEAISLAALEAMGSGSLVLCTPIGGLLEIISDNVNGLMSAGTSTDSLGELFLRAMNLPQNAYEILVHAARKHVEEKFTWDAVATAMIAKMRKHALFE